MNYTTRNGGIILPDDLLSFSYRDIIYIISRAGLRILPQLRVSIPGGRNDTLVVLRNIDQIIIPSFRLLSAVYLKSSFELETDSLALGEMSYSLLDIGEFGERIDACRLIMEACNLISRGNLIKTNNSEAVGGAVSALISASRKIGRNNDVSFHDCFIESIGEDMFFIKGLPKFAHSIEYTNRPLWPVHLNSAKAVVEFRRNWRWLSERLRNIDANFKVWTDWYSDRLRGRNLLAHDIEIFRVTLSQPNDWNSGFKFVNKLIAEKIAESQTIFERYKTEREGMPSPPAPKTASLEPVVIRGRVAVPAGAADILFDSAMMAAVLAAVAGEAAGLASDMRATPQYDQHAIAHLERVATKLEIGLPTHAAFFSICMEYETLRDFRARVAAEWPEIFVSRYSAVVGTLKSAVDKFPPWREFKKALPDEESELSADQMEVLRAAADATIDELRAPEHAVFVDPSTPDAIEKLAEEFAQAVAEMTATADPVPLRMALRAKDFVESLANTAKRFAELGVNKAAEVSAPVGGFAKRVGGKMAGGFTKELEKSLEKIAKDAGKDAPYAIGRFLKRAFVGGVVGGATLATAFPEAFGWLPTFIAALTAGAFPVPVPKSKRKNSERSKASDEGGEH